MKARSRAAVELLMYASGPVAALVTTPFLARSLGPEGRGEYGYALAVAAVAVTICNWGQPEVLLGEALHGRSYFAVARVISRAGSLVSFFAILIIVGIRSSIGIALAAAVFAPLVAQGNLWRSLAIMRSRTRDPASANMLGSALRLAVIPPLSVLGHLGPVSAVAFTQLATALGPWVFLRRNLGDDSSLARATWPRVRSGFMSGAKIVAFGGLTAVTMNAGVFALAAMSSTSQVGEYSAVLALGASALAVSAAFKSRIQAALFSEGMQGSFLTEVVRMLILGMAGALAAIFLANSISRIILGPEFHDGPSLIRIIAIAALGQMLLDSVHGALAVLGKRNALIVVAASGAFTATALSVALIPLGGAEGAAWATVVAFWLSGSVGTFLIVRGGSS